MILQGTDYSTSQDALRICKEYDGCEGITLRCTVGIHPHHATQTFEQRVKKDIYEAQLEDEKIELDGKYGRKTRGSKMADAKVVRYETTEVTPTPPAGVVPATNGSQGVPNADTNGASTTSNGTAQPPQRVFQNWVVLEAKYAKQYHTELEKLLLSPEGRYYCIAIGEIGLDYTAKSCNPLHQKLVFRKLLSLASRHSLPLYLHNRDAHADFLSILKPFLSTTTKAVVHCHTDSSIRNLRELLAAGVYIGLAGIVADKRDGRFNEEIVREVPLERMMVETDAPFLMPRNVPREMWGKRNEACLLPFVVRKIAQIKGDCTEREVAEATTKVAKEFFRL